MANQIQATDLDAAAQTAKDSGNPEQALRQLMAANRLDPDAEREVLIRNLRLTQELYGTRTPSPEGQAPVTLSYEQGMPTCTLAEITPDILRAAFADSGCLYIPNAIDTETTDRMRAAIEGAQNASQEDNPDPGWYSKPKMSSPDHALQVASARDYAHRSGGALAADSPRAMFQICDMLESNGITAIAQDYLGETPVMSADKFMLWRVAPGAATGWHQDGRFLGEGMDIASLNVWTALSDCGEDAPGMDLVLDDFDHYVKAEEGSLFDWTVSDAQVDEMAKQVPVVTPRFSAGDILMFDHWFLHRTSRTPQMTDTRYAIESWFFAPSVFPVGRSAMLA